MTYWIRKRSILETLSSYLWKEDALRVWNYTWQRTLIARGIVFIYIFQYHKFVSLLFEDLCAMKKQLLKVLSIKFHLQILMHILLMRIYNFSISLPSNKFIWLPLSLRASMEGYLDAYNPKTSVTPAGIFVTRVEVWDFTNAAG